MADTTCKQVRSTMRRKLFTAEEVLLSLFQDAEELDEENEIIQDSKSMLSDKGNVVSTDPSSTENSTHQRSAHACSSICQLIQVLSMWCCTLTHVEGRTGMLVLVPCVSMQSTHCPSPLLTIHSWSLDTARWNVT